MPIVSGMPTSETGKCGRLTKITSTWIWQVGCSCHLSYQDYFSLEVIHQSDYGNAIPRYGVLHNAQMNTN